MGGVVNEDEMNEAVVGDIRPDEQVLLGALMVNWGEDNRFFAALEEATGQDRRAVMDWLIYRGIQQSQLQMQRGLATIIQQIAEATSGPTIHRP